ncbi:MAG: hypothetical protein ACK5P7_03745 [Bdellovibrio sp.]
MARLLLFSTSVVLTMVLMNSARAAYVGAVSSATAESGRASVEATDAPYLNPASLAFLKGYLFSAGYSTASDKKSERARDFALALTDSMKETVVPTALSFAQSKADFTSEEQVARDFKLSFGNFFMPGLAIGFGLRYKDDQLPQDRYNQINGDIGGLYSINENLGFAAVLENVMGANGNVPEDLRLRPRTSVGAASIYRRFLRLRLDAISATNNSWDRPILAGGLETYMNKWMIFRLGAQRRNEENANVYSMGFGFSGPRFGIHYAYLTSPQQESFTRHTVDLAFPIW